MKKRLAIWILGLLMLTCAFSVEAMAADGYVGMEETAETVEYTWVNPMYPEAAQEDSQPERIEEETLPEDRAGSASVTYQSVDGAAKSLRAEMVKRSSTAVVYVKPTGGDPREMMSAVLEKAMAVDKNTSGREGDYIRWHLARASVVSGRHSVNGQVIGYSVVYMMSFYTNKSQEDQVTAKVKSVLSSLEVNKRTSYGKAKAIYDYICKNVKYDYAGVYDNTVGKYTAYNALINGRAVCQGYASLFYRMAREAGLQARFIPGASRSMPHAWNIVKLGNYYYNLDSTWDAGSAKYTYFLKNNKSFPDHTRESAYTTATFNKTYPMSSTSYKAIGVYSISKASVSGIKNKAYTGKKCTQNPVLKLGGSTLKKDRDYTISYKNNVNVGTASVVFKGKGNYSGTLTRTFKITLKKGAVYSVGAYKYRVTNVGASGKGAVNLAGTVNKARSSVKVYNEVKIGGKSMKVTGISANAFKNNKNLTSVSIGKNIKSIGDQAFYGASRLKTIAIKGTALKKVGPRAFYGIHKKASIQVKSNMLQTYQALLKNKGQSKSVVIR